MNKTEFMEALSELIMTEMEEDVQISSVRYVDGKAKEIDVTFNDNSKISILVLERL